MNEYLNELMAGEMEDEDKNPPTLRPQNQQGLSVGKGNGADGIGAVSSNVPPTTARGIAPSAEEQAAQTPVSTQQPVQTQQVAGSQNAAIPTPVASSSVDSDPNLTPDTDLKQGVGQPQQAPTAPGVDANGQPVVTNTELQQPEAPKLVQIGSPTYNQSGQFSSSNQSLQGLQNLKQLGLNPNEATFNKAIMGVQQYQANGQKSMPLEPGGVFVKGWKPEDFNSLVDWKKIDGIGRDIDVSKPEDRQAVQGWLASRFGAGLKGMHIDDKFGPYHVAAILEAAGKTPGDPTQPNQPIEPKRPDDPVDPTPEPYKDRYEEYLRKGYNPLVAMMGPEPKAIDTSRLRAIMGAQALGEGLRSIADVIHGPKGAPITEHKNNVTDWSIGKIDEAVRQFTSDKKEYRKMKLDALMHAMNDARVQSNMDRQDWRSGVQQMYDRFDKKVDRKDKQYQQDIERYDKSLAFKQSVDQFAAKLEQEGLNRAQAKELAIMQLNHAERMQANQIAAQRQLQEDAIKAGKYNGVGGGKHSIVEHIYTKKDQNTGKTEEVVEERLVPASISDDVNNKLADATAKDPVLKREVSTFRQSLKAQGVSDKNINRLILQKYIDKFYNYENGQWVPIGVGAAGASTVQPASEGAAQPAAGQNGDVIIKNL